MLAYLHDHKELLAWLGVFSVVSFIGSLLLIPILCVRMDEDYFMPHRDAQDSFDGGVSAARWIWRLVRHLIGLLLIVVGLLMLVLPGQGVLTILIGVMLLNFPGKRALELRLIRIHAVFRTINALRARAQHPPLQLPPERE